MRPIVLALLAALTLAPRAGAQDEGSFVINLRDTEIATLAEQVAAITGRTLVLDPSLSGEVTVVSSEPLDADGVWALFQSILRGRGYTAIRLGALWQIVPESEARARAQVVDPAEAGREDIDTRLLRLDRLPAAEAVRVLRPLVAESGYIEALEDPNAVLLTDTRANIERLAALVAEIDGGTDAPAAQVVRLRQADAVEVGASIAAVLGEEASARLSVDRGANALLVRGGIAEVAEVRRLASALDVAAPPDPEIDILTRVFALSFGDAEVVAELVAGALTGAVPVSNAVAEAVQEGTATEAEQVAAGPASVLASSETNAVIVRGTAAQVADAAALIHALDKRRPQVQIEAAIVEVSAEVGQRLGVQLGLGADVPEGGFAATSLTNGGPTLQSILLALGQTGAGALSTGLSLGAGGGEFGLLLNALGQSSAANLLSTPSVTTMDNEPATIVVAQNVPFRTGAFLTEGATTTPFTTIERQDVGITMQVIPRVTAGGVVRLDISQEVSSLVNANVLGAADLITNRRVIDTTVLADNGGTVVLGGLITEDRTEAEDKVPGLGDVPVVGGLFRSRQAQTTRRTLFVFIRPTILIDRQGAETVAANRLGRLRAAEAVRPGVPARRDPLPKLPLEINGLY